MSMKLEKKRIEDFVIKLDSIVLTETMIRKIGLKE